MTRLLPLFCLGLALLAAWPWMTASEAPVGAAAVPETWEPPAAVALPEVPPLAALTETTDRPLFSPTRRPRPVADAAPAAAPEPASAAAAIGRYRLQGVIITGERRLVLLAPPADGKPLQLSLGDEVEGWTVQGIEADALTMRSGSKVERVPLVPAAVSESGQDSARNRAAPRNPQAAPPPGAPGLGVNRTRGHAPPAGLPPPPLAPKQP